MAFPVDEVAVITGEEHLGRSLPDALRTRLMRDNGGEVRTTDDIWQLHPVFDRSDRKRIARTANHILRETAAAKDWWGFPEDAVAVAANGAGDLLILLPEDDRIHRWSHETAATEPVNVLW